MRWSSWRCRMHARCKNTQIQKSKYIVSTWCMYGEEGTRKMCRRRRGPAGASCVRCFIWHGDAPLSSHIPSLPCLFLFFLFLTFLSLQPAAACVFCFICQGMPLPVVHRPPTPIQPLPSLWQGAKKCLGWLYPQHVDWVPLSPLLTQKSPTRLRRSHLFSPVYLGTGPPPKCMFLPLYLNLFDPSGNCFHNMNHIWTCFHHQTLSVIHLSCLSIVDQI